MSVIQDTIYRTERTLSPAPFITMQEVVADAEDKDSSSCNIFSTISTSKEFKALGLCIMWIEKKLKEYHA